MKEKDFKLQVYDLYIETGCIRDLNISILGPNLLSLGPKPLQFGPKPFEFGAEASLVWAQTFRV